MKKLELSFPSDTEIRFVRYFDAPRDLVWRGWTEAAHLEQWMTGPDGWTMEVLKNELRPGGAWEYVWRRSNGTEMRMHGVHHEVVAPEKLVSTENWGDPWPESINHLLLTEEQGRTRMTLTISYISKQARDNAAQTGMADGMEPSFARLDELLIRA